MFFRGGYGSDPRLEKYDTSVTGGLNSWIVRHPIRAPILGFAIAGALFATSYFTGRMLLSRFAIPVVIVSLILLVYGLVRKAVDISRRIAQEGEALPEEPLEAPGEVDELARRVAVSRWKERAWRERAQPGVGAKRGRNTGEQSN